MCNFHQISFSVMDALINPLLSLFLTIVTLFFSIWYSNYSGRFSGCEDEEGCTTQCPEDATAEPCSCGPSSTPVTRGKQ